MNTLSKVMQSLITKIICALLILVLGVVSTVATRLHPLYIPPQMQQDMLRIILGMCAGVFLLLSFIAYLLVVIIRNGEPRLSVFQGFRWDKQNNPHCSSCNKPLTYRSEKRDRDRDHFLYCASCKESFPIDLDRELYSRLRECKLVE